MARETEEMLQLGVIEPSQSAWRSPIMLVPKPDGSAQFCVDYCELNKVAHFDAYPMPRTDLLLDQLGAAKFLSALDLTKGYWQVPVQIEDRPKTAFATPQGQFQFIKMPFGLHGAAATFQQLFNTVLAHCRDFTAAYIDDIIIFSPDWDTHLQHVQTVLEALRVAGLKANPLKNHLGFRELKYLGFLVGHGTVKTTPGEGGAAVRVPPPVYKAPIASVPWTPRVL